MPRKTSIWLDGAPAETLPLPDRGLDFGDGLFETLLLFNGQPLFPQFHFERLARGLNVLGIPDCLAQVREQITNSEAAMVEQAGSWAALRLTISRGGGPRGYASPENPRPRIVMQLTGLERDCSVMSAPATLCDTTVRLATQPLLAGIKHLNRLEQVLAATQAQQAGADEALLLDQSGHLNSVSAGNLFLVRAGTLLTPLLHECGVSGTRRRLIIERWAPALGIEVLEQTLTPADLSDADEVFYCNSLQGLRPIAGFGGLHWHSHPVCHSLFQQYQRDWR